MGRVRLLAADKAWGSGSRRFKGPFKSRQSFIAKGLTGNLWPIRLFLVEARIFHVKMCLRGELSTHHIEYTGYFPSPASVNSFFGLICWSVAYRGGDRWSGRCSSKFCAGLVVSFTFGAPLGIGERVGGNIRGGMIACFTLDGSNSVRRRIGDLRIAFLILFILERHIGCKEKIQ